MSTEATNGFAKSKSLPSTVIQAIHKPPAVPPPPLPNPMVFNNKKSASVTVKPQQSKSLRNHSTQISNATHPPSTQQKQQKQENGAITDTKRSASDPIPKWHQFGTLLLGMLTATKQHNPEGTPTLHATDTTDAPMTILTARQRDILSNIIITILSNAKNKKLPDFDFLGLRKSSCDGLYSSESDEGSVHADREENNHETTSTLQEEMEDADFTEIQQAEHSNSSSRDRGDHPSTDKASVAKIVLSQKEKLLLMTSISKYVESQSEMDTIHRACFNLWKDWYRCYGTITNQFQSAFMAVCESLLGTVDSRALAREPPLPPVTNPGSDRKKEKSIEAITYMLSTQISTLKHAFAVEQLNSPSHHGQKSHNVPQIIDGMEPNVWCVVKHIIFEYFKSPYWIECKYTLFNLFLHQYESVHRRLDREFISTSSFGVYTLICQLSKDKRKTDKDKPQKNEFELFDLDREEHLSQEEEEEEEEEEEDELMNSSYSNEDLLQTLNWYYALCRLETLLSNKRQDYLTVEIYELYQPMFAPLFQYFHKFDDPDHNVLTLIQSIVEESDYSALKARYEMLLKAEKMDKKKEKETFVSLLARIMDSCMNWICRDLYPNYRKSEFCVLLTQLLADPAHFKTKKEEARSIRIIRLHERFNLPPDQPLVNSFSCALDTGKFLHHGRIYFFKDYVCFYSSMFGIRDTQQKFLLPVTEIKTVARKVTAWVFNNAIEIQMKDGRAFTFRTFMKRDTTFELLKKLINGKVDWEAVEKQQQKEFESEEKEEDKDNVNKKDNDSGNSGKELHKSVMNEISGLVMNAIDVSSSKLLSTDAKLLLQSKSKHKRKSSLDTLSNVACTNEEIDNLRNIPIPMQVALTKTRSAPISPMVKKRDLYDWNNGKKENNKKASSDTEIVSCDDDDDEELEEKVQTTAYIEKAEAQTTQYLIDRTQLAAELRPPIMIAKKKESKEELEAKCERLNSMHCEWIYSANSKVEKDFEVIVEFEFKNIGIDEFWDKFWSNHAIFSPIDWLRAEPLNSKIKADEWQPAPQIDGDGDESWFTRNVSCVTKLEDMPAFFPKSIAHCTSEQEFRYCKVDPYFYVVHKIIGVNDIPFADCYNTHQKTEFRQSATLIDDDEISLSTHCKMYFGVEWTKSTWLKSPIRSRTLISIKQDCAKYCDEVNRRILALRNKKAPQNEEEERATKPGKKAVYVKSFKALSDVAEMDDDDEDAMHVERDTMEIMNHNHENINRDGALYDFVFKMGHKNSFIRCECKCSTSLIVLLVVLSIVVIISSLYALSMVITLVSSVSTVLTSSAQYIDQLSSQMKLMNHHCSDVIDPK